MKWASEPRPLRPLSASGVCFLRSSAHRILKWGGGRPANKEVARTLAAMAKIEPFEWTEEERAAHEADRQARKAWEKAHFDERADKLRRMWE